jgi:hypothetical protein
MIIVTNLNQATVYSHNYGNVEYPVEEYTVEELSELSEQELAALTSVDYNKNLPEVPLHFWFDITSEPEVVWFKFINAALNTTIFNFKLDYNIIKNHINYSDQTLWGISNNFRLAHDTHITQNNSPYIVTKSDIVPILCETFVSKETQINLKSLNFNDVPIKMFVPYKNCPLTEVKFYLAKPVISDDYRKVPISFIGPDGSTATVSTTSVTEEIASLLPGETGYKAGWLDLISNITVQSDANIVNVGDNITVNISVEDPNISSVYVEPVVGYTNKTRVALTNGQGSVIVKTDDLQAGDEVRIKFGYKYFTGVAEYTKLIT